MEKSTVDQRRGSDLSIGLFVAGKTGQRPLIDRDRAIRPLERQLELNPNLKGKTLDEVIESKCKDYVFVTRYGERAARANLSRNFETLLKSLKIIYFYVHLIKKNT